MQVTETLTNGLKRGFTVTVSGADLQERRDKRLTELTKTMRIPGFRPGKVPLNLVRKRFGEAVDAEVIQESVNEATDRVLSERNLRPAVSPKVEVTQRGSGSDLEFKVEMEVLPDIVIPDLTVLTLARLKAPVTEQEVQEALEGFAKQRATAEHLDEVRPVAEGEVITVDFAGSIGGEAFEGGTATDVDIEIGAAGFIPGFVEQIAGIAPREHRTISVTFPENYQATHLAGKAAEFAVTAKALKRKRVPDLNEAFAEELGFESLADVKKFFRERLEGVRAGASRMKLKRALLDQLAEQAKFPVPESLVEAEFSEIWRQVEAERQAGRSDADDAGKDEATLRSEYRAIADRRVRLGLLVAEIGRLNKIEISESEVRRAMMAELQRYPGQEKQIMDFYQKNPRALDRLRGPIFEDKVIDYVVERAQVTETEVTFAELMEDVDGQGA